MGKFRRFSRGVYWYVFLIILCLLQMDDRKFRFTRQVNKISSQERSIMAETPYTQPRRPDVIKKHKSDAFQNPNSNWFKLTFVSGSISGYLLSQLNNYPDYEMFLVAGALAIGLLWLKVCGLNPRRADKSMIKFWFFIREIRGKNIMHKLTSKDNDLRTVYPLKKIHNGGLIQFIGKEYGALIKL